MTRFRISVSASSCYVLQHCRGMHVALGLVWVQRDGHLNEAEATALTKLKGARTAQPTPMEAFGLRSPQLGYRPQKAGRGSVRVFFNPTRQC